MKNLFAFLTALTLVWLSVLSCSCFLSCNRAPEVPDPEAGLPAFPKPAEQISSVPLTRTEAAEPAPEPREVSFQSTPSTETEAPGSRRKIGRAHV